jgi:hypothetical protein
LKSNRNDIYYEWYEKKMKKAKEELKRAQDTKKDEEEKKAQELINKLQKSSVVFDIWNQKKSDQINLRKKALLMNSISHEEKLIEKKEKQKDAKLAFDKWLEVKVMNIKERKEKDYEEKRKIRIKEEKEKEKKMKERIEKRPPLPFDTWSKSKEYELNQKKSTLAQQKEEKKQSEEEKLAKRRLAQQSYREWLAKKDEELDKPKKSLSSSMTSLPPFYPASRTIAGKH